MNTIATFASFIVLSIGAISLLREAGYDFDLRRRPRRRVSGGRRAQDARA